MKTVVDRIQACPPFREFDCEACGVRVRVHALQMYVSCPGCQVHQKCRGFGEIGSEIEDVIDAALQWASVTREEVAQRHQAESSQ